MVLKLKIEDIFKPANDKDVSDRRLSQISSNLKFRESVPNKMTWPNAVKSWDIVLVNVHPDREDLYMGIILQDKSGKYIVPEHSPEEDPYSESGDTKYNNFNTFEEAKNYAFKIATEWSLKHKSSSYVGMFEDIFKPATPDDLEDRQEESTRQHRKEVGMDRFHEGDRVTTTGATGSVADVTWTKVSILWDKINHNGHLDEYDIEYEGDREALKSIQTPIKEDIFKPATPKELRKRRGIPAPLRDVGEFIGDKSEVEAKDVGLTINELNKLKNIEATLYFGISGGHGSGDFADVWIINFDPEERMIYFGYKKGNDMEDRWEDEGSGVLHRDTLKIEIDEPGID